MADPVNKEKERSFEEENLYRRLARHLDRQPGGFPETPHGVEIRILKLLFAPEEAALALHLNLLEERAEVLAFRAGMPGEKAAGMLESMASKGLIFRSVKKDGIPRYMAAQFIVGIWELQVGRLSLELVEAMESYVPWLVDAGAWQKAPQMRVIPVSESIDADLRVMTYEKAFALIENKKSFVVAPCICRLEMGMQQAACDRPLETCINFGEADDYYRWTGAGREASREEVREILQSASRAGLVLQPSNDREVKWICCCCGCCCGLLRTFRQLANPGEVVASPFYARLEDSLCTGCGICLRRCPMGAFSKEKKSVYLDKKRCIGCGLCVDTCPVSALGLVRKDAPPPVPSHIALAMLKLAWKRKKLDLSGFVKMLAASLADRLRTKLF
ncbi:4Fe-4S dicluster protein [Desulfobotulus alkaliphilus]|uniref:4Fe-4S dicluster protein n=1 Tax=Desulfobotulus alkaliphilus TaxID=622671 RepID=A0A562RP36_9BACT|nr:4Fe-4S binding protein [Desulfobotulus alkaliphilus]TWI70314.1 4Fe-4S dicluster protein [Desulfobotulus alkaliphilus]